MDHDILEELLLEEEGPTLDFKRDQYPLTTDEEKSELIKDILAFANAWRGADAYILCGVQEVRGGRSQPVGVSSHHDDANLQQLINSKTNRTIEFVYEAVGIDDVQIGVLRVRGGQRPYYLKRDFGKLKQHVVPIREGTSTRYTDLDQIAREGMAIELRPKLKLRTRLASGAYTPDVIFSIENEKNAGSAQAPLLCLKCEGPWNPAPWGIDGNGAEGLPQIPGGMGDYSLDLGTDMNVVIHPGSSLNAIRLRYARHTPATELRLAYHLSAHNFGPVEDVMVVKF